MATAAVVFSFSCNAMESEGTEYYPGGAVHKKFTGIDEVTEYDEGGNVKSVANPLETTFYDENGKVKFVKDQHGNYTDAMGNTIYFPESTKYYPSGAVHKKFTTVDEVTEYYENGYRKVVTNPLETTFYDENGKVKFVKDQHGNYTDAAGHPMLSSEAFEG
ncbi:MAG: hypothetical protein KA112_04365 [Alphaproteobacteria bacterium]|jgi:hypothetical protein|nr:hypothetical protein [Alphaproteobacteria bacterium]